MGPINRMKPQIVSQILEEVDFLLVVVDPRQPGVVLPPDLQQNQDPVPLHIGHGMAIPIPDLSVTADGISCTLSFNRTPFHCQLPWPAIFQIATESEHLIWLTPPQAGLPDTPDATAERPKLRLV